MPAQTLAARFLPILIAVLVAACGTDDDPVQGTYATLCQIVCDDAPTEDRCSDFDTRACVSECVARTEGFANVCAQCMVEQSEWRGCGCWCNDDGDCLLACGGVGFPPSPGDTCDVAQETCEFELGKSSTDCAAQCASD